MAKLRLYTCCILFLLLLIGMGMVAAIFLVLWHRGITGSAELELMQQAVLLSVFKLVGFYIVLTAAILTCIGYFFLSCKLLQPIERLTVQAEEWFGGQQGLLFSNDSDEGCNGLSRLLDHLMQRLGNEAQQLRETVQALEQANADLLAAQQEMIRAEKLVSIGRLSAGLVHEIGNPLTILSGYLQLLTNEEISSEQAEDFLERAGKEVGRINILLQRLLEFARPSAGEVQSCSMHQLIRECFDDLCYQPLFNDIECILCLDAPLDLVMADPIQIRQILLNCAVNAADAIHEKNDGPGQTITVRTALRKQEEDTDCDRQLVIELQDTGTGIAPEHLPSLFDPFFSTKDAGRGTGLGLSVCYMIIQEMGGTIEINGEPGQGAVVTIVLPVVDQR